MMMVLLLAATGVAVVLASFWSKWDTQKSMNKLRNEEAAFREKVVKLRGGS